MDHKFRALIIDDDPTHLEIYGKIVNIAGFEAETCWVLRNSIPYPDARVDLVILDYRLNSEESTPSIAQQLRKRYPAAPIILLSDVSGLPTDIAPFVDSFVRKGEPEQLIACLRSHKPAATPPSGS